MVTTSMMRIVIPFLVAAFLGNPLHAFTTETGIFDGLEFAADTRMSGTQGRSLSLCHTTKDFRILGFAVSSNILGYALADDGCTRRIDRPFNKIQVETAQAFGLIDPDLPSVPVNSLERTLQNAAIWIAISLGMIAVIIRRTKSLSGRNLGRPMRKKASDRILQVMCHVGNCDGIVTSKEIALIAKTATRLTRRNVKSSDVVHVANHIRTELTALDFVKLGHGLRVSEKDVLMQSAFYVALANGRIAPAEHGFLTELASGLGVPGEDFRRLMNLTLLDLDLNPPT